jgi:hypothetical protein
MPGRLSAGWRERVRRFCENDSGGGPYFMPGLDESYEKKAPK